MLVFPRQTLMQRLMFAPDEPVTGGDAPTADAPAAPAAPATSAPATSSGPTVAELAAKIAELDTHSKGIAKKLSEERQARKDAAAAVQQAEEQRRVDAGEFDKLYREKVADLEKLQKSIADAETARTAQAEIDNQKKMVRDAAKLIGFNDPDDAVLLVDLNTVTSSVVAEDLVRRVSEGKAYLLKKGGVRSSIESDGTQARRLTEAEVLRMGADEVDAALKAGKLDHLLAK